MLEDYNYDTVLTYYVTYDKAWIYDNDYHEINQLCNAHTLQNVYIDEFYFDQIGQNMKCAAKKYYIFYVPGIGIINVRMENL